MSFELRGKVAVVTGAGSGIGAAIAVRFASAGAVVRVLDLSLEAAEGTAAQIAAAQATADKISASEGTAEKIAAGGGAATVHVCDVGDAGAVNEAFEKIFGLGRVDILVNNAGVSHIGTVESTGEADFDRVYRINVKGVYNGMKACVGHMKEKGGGVILNMASIAGTAALADRFAYSMSKGAVVAMTYSVAKDYVAHGIRCNCISPARVHTPFVDDYLARNYPGREKEMYEKLAKSAPMGRMGKPEEVAALALFLCSDEASFITGVDYPLDGGFFNLRG
jgi:2-keto-3-deoxy-L-fuconate dehydrogenase